MNLPEIERQTIAMVEAGHRVFQIHRFARSEREHVKRLERWSDFPAGAAVLDMGSGTGEVSKIMSELRPDMSFFLVNLSAVQLGFSPSGMRRHCGDFCNVPEPAGTFDAAMFCFSIGHADIASALHEAARLLKPSGVLFIYDMVRVSGDNSVMDAVSYQTHPRQVIEGLAKDQGLKLDVYMEPQDDGAYGRSVLGGTYDQIFNGTIPAIWRFIKC